jgi:hypothetical protein
MASNGATATFLMHKETCGGGVFLYMLSTFKLQEKKSSNDMKRLVNGLTLILTARGPKERSYFFYLFTG